MVTDELDMVDGSAHVSRIDDQPILRERLALEILSDQLAHDRAGAVGTDDVAGAHDVPCARPAVERGGDVVGVLVERDERHTERHSGRAVRGQSGTQASLQVRLIERHELRMAIDAPQRIDAPELAEPGRAHPDVRNRHRIEVGFVHPDVLQDAKRVVVERDRTRRHEDLRRPVDDKHAHAVPAEKCTDRRADGTAAHHEHVYLRRQVAAAGTVRVVVAFMDARLARQFCLHHRSVSHSRDWPLLAALMTLKS